MDCSHKRSHLLAQLQLLCGEALLLGKLDHSSYQSMTEEIVQLQEKIKTEQRAVSH